MSLSSALDSLAESSAALAPFLPDLLAADDTRLMTSHARLAEARRHIDAMVSASSAELVRRSHRDLGYDGLAQRLGSRTPQHLVEQLTGVSRREASALVRVGSLEPDSPLAISVAAGSLSIGAADAINTGLGSPSEHVPPSVIDRAAARILQEAPTLTVDELAARARALRDELDAQGVAAREEQLRERRYLRLSPQQDGMVRIAGLLDPESAALVTDAFDAVTSPRRGGPRFVDPAKQRQATEVESDPRTLDQLMLDTFVEIVGAAAVAPASGIFGLRRPAVRVLVAERDLAGDSRANDAATPGQSTGFGHLEGTSTNPGPTAVSLATVARHACDSGIQPIVVGSGGDVLKLGHLRRLFSPQQRMALAARDGGCRFPGCSRPPSWCEAHHIVPWSIGGRTDIADGMLLCRHHHLLVHKNGWTVTRDASVYQLIPPRSIDPAQRPRPMPSKSAAWREVTRVG